MRVVQVTNLALQSEPARSELFLCAWRYVAGFTFRHNLHDYLSLCGATFPTRSLAHLLILPMSHKDLKRFFFVTFATVRWKQIYFIYLFID